MNIVLVHGAWVDGSGWQAVYKILKNRGYNVWIVQQPLTSFIDDVATTKAVLDLQNGPTILVGHSYGGSIITEAGMHPNVVGLVYVAAHAPDVGESEGNLAKMMPSSLPKSAIIETSRGYTFLQPVHFLQNFAPDLPRAQAEFQAISQVMTAKDVFTSPITFASWRFKPSWAVVAGSDQIINPQLERMYYQRANSSTIEIAGASHSVYASRPNEVADVITKAAKGICW